MQTAALHPVPMAVRNFQHLHSGAAAMRSLVASALPLLLATLLMGCAEAGTPIKTVEQVDLPRFMGRWYVIGIIPTRLERGNHNPVETYRLDRNGNVCT